jgi:hypothetical protein
MINNATIQSAPLNEDKYYITASGGLLFRWKLWASIYLSSGAVGLCLLTLVAHFDTIFFPKFWVAVFRDGSLAERNWILFLLLLWTAALHASTSILSVGEYQANVYFTTWIGFGATALTYGVWRESAGLVSLTEKAINQHRRETTYNWICTGVFSAIFAGSATFIYINREVVELRFRGEQLSLDVEDWTMILAIIWTEVGVCALVVAFNEIFVTSWQFPCRVRRRKGVYRFVFGWRQLEGLIIFVSVGAKFYAILKYTGVNGVVNGLSNAYFAIWGSFFNSVFAFGTWLRENKNLEWVVREQPPQQGVEDVAEVPPTGSPE